MSSVISLTDIVIAYIDCWNARLLGTVELLSAMVV